MTLKRRNGRFLVFSRIDKTTQDRIWIAGKVEKGMLNILVTDRDWNVAIKAVEMLSVGKITEFGQWLDGYNAAIMDDCNRVSAVLTQ